MTVILLLFSCWWWWMDVDKPSGELTKHVTKFDPGGVQCSHWNGSHCLLTVLFWFGASKPENVQCCCLWNQSTDSGYTITMQNIKPYKSRGKWKPGMTNSNMVRKPAEVQFQLHGIGKEGKRSRIASFSCARTYPFVIDFDDISIRLHGRAHVCTFQPSLWG